jgi:hypothetical protein
MTLTVLVTGPERVIRWTHNGERRSCPATVSQLTCFPLSSTCQAQ